MGLLTNVIGKILGIGGKKPEDTLVGSILTKNLPNKAEVNKIMMEIEREYNKSEHEYEMGFMDVVKSAATLTQYDTKLSVILKGSSRWIIALMFTCFYIYSRLTGLPLTPFDTQLMAGLWGFLFLMRSAEKMLKKDK